MNESCEILAPEYLINLPLRYNERKKKKSVFPINFLIDNKKLLLEQTIYFLVSDSTKFVKLVVGGEGKILGMFIELKYRKCHWGSYQI